jgi:hypothetical protein
MKTLTVKKFDVMSVANFSAVLSAAVALFYVVASWVIAMVNYAQLNAYAPNAVDWNTGFGLLAIIVVPLMAAVSGWIGGAIVAWFYNVALGGSNGIKVDVEE